MSGREGVWVGADFIWSKNALEDDDKISVFVRSV